MIALTDRTKERLEGLFFPEDLAEAERVLVRECAEGLPVVGAGATPESLERVRFAAIRVSAGKMEGLRRAVALAQLDWRDLLLAAGFADRTIAHLEWMPRRLSNSMIDAWLSGDGLEGVEFGTNASVEVLGGEHRGQRGSIVGLVGLEPETGYLVELGTGEEVEVPQRFLGRAG